MQNGKSPGNDGLPKEFYVHFFEVLKDELVNCINLCWQKGTLTESQSQALVVLIQKPGKDLRFLSSWRPISLINVDAKLISKVLSNRIEPLMPILVSQEQSAFVRGRYIGEPIRLVSDILYETQSQKCSGLLFAADFAAAFDSIDFCILFQVLSKFGFDEHFLRWIRLLHNNSKSCIMNGGYSTGYFPLKRGTRQGDPLAPYLFLLVIEILIAMVRQNKNILGIEINGYEFKQCVLPMTQLISFMTLTPFQN